LYGVRRLSVASDSPPLPLDTGALPLIGGGAKFQKLLRQNHSVLSNSRFCRQDAQDPTPPTFSIVMRVRYPGGASGGGKPVPGPNIAVVNCFEQFRCAALLDARRALDRQTRCKPPTAVGGHKGHQHDWGPKFDPPSRDGADPRVICRGRPGCAPVMSVAPCGRTACSLSVVWSAAGAIHVLGRVGAAPR
jgi:hypothetical protein